MLISVVLLAVSCTSGSNGAGPDPSVAEDPTTTSEPDGTGTTSVPTPDGGTSTSATEPEIAMPDGVFVSPEGNDSNSGASPEDAWGTVSFAVSQLQAGDTLWVMDGVYQEQQTAVIKASGSEDDYTVVTAFPDANPVIESVHINTFTVEASYVEVSNLELRGSVAQGVDCYCGSGIFIDAQFSGDNHHVRVLGNTISGFGAGGVPVWGTSHVEIRDNVIFDVAKIDPDQHSGISILEPKNMGFDNDEDGYSNYITGNTVYQVENQASDSSGNITDGNCVILDRTNVSGYSGRTLVANNVCIDNGGRGIQIFESSRVDVVNNTVFESLGTPEIASRGGDLGAVRADDVLFANNLVFTRSGLSPVLNDGSSNLAFRSNVYAADTAPRYAGAIESGDRIVPLDSAIVENASADPLAVDFQLLEDSVAVNAGIDGFSSLLETDITGRSRKLGSSVDVGAYERG